MKHRCQRQFRPASRTTACFTVSSRGDSRLGVCLGGRPLSNIYDQRLSYVIARQPLRGYISAELRGLHRIVRKHAYEARPTLRLFAAKMLDPRWKPPSSASLAPCNMQNDFMPTASIASGSVRPGVIGKAENTPGEPRSAGRGKEAAPADIEHRCSTLHVPLSR
eukprot:1999940-Pleurochrysis_carterae.AAC.1